MVVVAGAANAVVVAGVVVVVGVADVAVVVAGAADVVADVAVVVDVVVVAGAVDVVADAVVVAGAVDVVADAVVVAGVVVVVGVADVVVVAGVDVSPSLRLDFVADMLFSKRSNLCGSDDGVVNKLVFIQNQCGFVLKKEVFHDGPYIHATLFYGCKIAGLPQTHKHMKRLRIRLMLM